MLATEEQESDVPKKKQNVRKLSSAYMEMMTLIQNESETPEHLEQLKKNLEEQLGAVSEFTIQEWYKDCSKEKDVVEHASLLLDLIPVAVNCWIQTRVFGGDGYRFFSPYCSMKTTYSFFIWASRTSFKLRDLIEEAAKVHSLFIKCDEVEEKDMLDDDDVVGLFRNIKPYSDIICDTLKEAVIGGKLYRIEYIKDPNNLQPCSD